MQIHTLCFFVVFDVIVDTAYVKNSGKWYSCDDSKCSELSGSKVVVSLNFYNFCDLFTLIYRPLMPMFSFIKARVINTSLNNI